MCRIAAYQGPSIPLENIITKPKHSLLTQSQNAAESKLAVNGDGFGIAWYDGLHTAPGLYRDVLPAWADENLMTISRMIRAPLFLAHVRASTVGETVRTNCHPFSFGRWSFCHNGQVPHIGRVRRRMEADLSDALYMARRGSTDSELLFLSLLNLGLDDDPVTAFERLIKAIGPDAPDGPVRLTCVLSDGASLYALRHASDGRAPTLYVSSTLDNGGRALASEPLDGCLDRWRAVPIDTLFRMEGNHDTEQRLNLLQTA